MDGAGVALAAPPPGWVDGSQSCAGPSAPSPAPQTGRRLQLREQWGARRQPQGLAKPQVCYETLPVVETFLRDRDRLPRLLPRCLLSPHSPNRALCSLPGSLALTHFSLSLSPALSLPPQQVSSISCSVSPYQGSSRLAPQGPPRSRQPLDSHSSTTTHQLGDLGQVN